VRFPDDTVGTTELLSPLVAHSGGGITSGG
jgi:hypothetical protein